MDEIAPPLNVVARRATRQKGPSYSMDDLQTQYPSLRSLAQPPGKAGERAWVAAFTYRPDALESMLADLIKQAYAKPGRIGQRPMPKEAEVNLEALLNGEYSEDPIQVVLPKLIKISERGFCERVYMNRRTFQRMMLPNDHPKKHHPDMHEIQRIAEAVKRPPSFFVEYRQIAAQAAFVKLINERPVIATRLYREFLEVYRQSPV